VTARCVAVLGGSFDPVHLGHVALGEFFAKCLHADELRIVPAGNPWQKEQLQASGADRVEMIRRAFDGQTTPVVIDQQEIRRGAETYTIDTLKELRAAFGPFTSIVFLIGADQLQQLDTWRDWRQLFDFANICAAARPGFATEGQDVPESVMREFALRDAPLERIRATAFGLAHVANELAVDISATALRTALQRGEKPEMLVPPGVLDYIEQHHLYKS